MARVVELDRYPILLTNHPLHRGVEVQRQAVTEFIQHGADVFSRTPGHDVPLRTMRHIQQAVIVKETQKERQRKTFHLLQRR